MADISTLVNDALEYPLQKTKQWRTASTELEGEGLPNRRAEWSAPRYLFRWELFYATKAERDAFEAFFDARKGGAGDFTWTPTAAYDGNSYTCTFASDELDLILDGPEEWGCAVRVLAVAV